MNSRIVIVHAPFSKEVAERIMHEVMPGVNRLHSHDIVHRDLKANNAPVREVKDRHHQCFVCDFECSIGVIETGYFRAPEILQILLVLMVGFHVPGVGQSFVQNAEVA